MSNNDKLIAEFRDSVAEKNRARIIIAGLVLTTVIVFTFIALSALNGFLVSSVPEISTLVTKRINENSDQYVRYLNRSVDKVVPVYSEEIQSTLKKEWPTIEKAAETEFLALNHYAQKRWPSFQHDLANIAIAQESTIQSELDKVLTQDQAKQISDNYTLAALNAYKDFVRLNFTEHGKVGESVAANLFKVMDKEPDVTSEVDVNEAIGLALEVIGLQLQEISKK